MWYFESCDIVIVHTYVCTYLVYMYFLHSTSKYVHVYVRMYVHMYVCDYVQTVFLWLRFGPIGIPLEFMCDLECAILHRTVATSACTHAMSCQAETTLLIAHISDDCREAINVEVKGEWFLFAASQGIGYNWFVPNAIAAGLWSHSHWKVSRWNSGNFYHVGFANSTGQYNQSSKVCRPTTCLP